MNVNIECLNEYVQKVGTTVNYWMIRTMGGDYYDAFVDNGYIAIGYNDIPLQRIAELPQDHRIAVRQLKGYIAEHHQLIENSGHVASQLYRFCSLLGEGDIVVLPGRSSFRMAVCRVTGPVYEEEENPQGVCPFRKRIPVTVLRRTSRLSLSPKAQLMFNSRHPVSDISSYAHYIDNTLHDFYDKGDELHLVLKVNTPNDVSTSQFFAMERFIDLARMYCEENGVEVGNDDIVMKVQMESPGVIHYITKNKKLLCILAFGILFVNGGGLKIDTEGFKLDLSTPGLFDNISEFMDRRTDREMRVSMKAALDSLQIETPEDFQKAVIGLYNAQNEGRVDY